MIVCLWTLPSDSDFATNNILLMCSHLNLCKEMAASLPEMSDSMSNRPKKDHVNIIFIDESFIYL